MNRRGELLVENVVFIILNMVFLGILIIFLLNKGSGVLIMEETYSKQVALLVDASRPGTSMEINMENLYEESKKKNYPFENVISFSENYVSVKLGDDSGYRYHYFNNVSVNAYPAEDEGGEFTGNYIVTVSKNE